MTKLIASVKDQVTKEIYLITSEEHSTKSAFAKELKSGLTVRFIATEDTFDEECEKFYAKQEHARQMAKIRRDAKKETARMIAESNAKVKAERDEAKLAHRKVNFINDECAERLMVMYAKMGLNVAI